MRPHPTAAIPSLRTFRSSAVAAFAFVLVFLLQSVFLAAAFGPTLANLTFTSSLVSTVGVAGYTLTSVQGNTAFVELTIEPTANSDHLLKDNSQFFQLFVSLDHIYYVMNEDVIAYYAFDDAFDTETLYPTKFFRPQSGSPNVYINLIGLGSSKKMTIWIPVAAPLTVAAAKPSGYFSLRVVKYSSGDVLVNDIQVLLPLPLASFGNKAKNDHNLFPDSSADIAFTGAGTADDDVALVYRTTYYRPLSFTFGAFAINFNIPRTLLAGGAPTCYIMFSLDAGFPTTTEMSPLLLTLEGNDGAYTGTISNSSNMAAFLDAINTVQFGDRRRFALTCTGLRKTADFNSGTVAVVAPTVYDSSKLATDGAAALFLCPETKWRLQSNNIEYLTIW